MRTDLDEDPAVVGMATSLNVSETQIVGWLWKLWSIASKQTDNGWLPHYTPQKLDGLVSHSGFSAALEEVGWLHPRAGGLQIPNFEHWLSKSAKRRFKESARKKEGRKVSACEADENGKPLLLSPVLSSPIGKGGAGERGPPKSVFVRPTVEEVRAYCAERGNSVDPERWLAHYESNGWKVGRNAMRDWKAAVRTWERNAFGDTNGNTGRNLGQNSSRIPASPEKLAAYRAKTIRIGDVGTEGTAQSGEGSTHQANGSGH